jgi:hypothetical protein
MGKGVRTEGMVKDVSATRHQELHGIRTEGGGRDGVSVEVHFDDFAIF